MLSPRLTDCPECANIPSLLRKIDCKLAELGNNLYNNISYMLNKSVPANDILQLIGYRRILMYKYYNPNYVHKYSVAMIASRVIRLTSGCVSKCNTPEPCIEERCDITIVPNPTTTTSTTAIPTTTTTSTSTSTSSSTTTTTTTTAITSICFCIFLEGSGCAYTEEIPVLGNAPFQNGRPVYNIGGDLPGSVYWDGSQWIYASQTLAPILQPLLNSSYYPIGTYSEWGSTGLTGGMNSSTLGNCSPTTTTTTTIPPTTTTTSSSSTSTSTSTTTSTSTSTSSSSTTSTSTTAVPTTTTTSSSSTSTTTSTSSSTTTTTTTVCVNRPVGLTNGNLIQAVNNPGDPSRNFSNVSVAYACDTFNYFRSVPIITGSGASYIDMQYSTLAIGEVIYKDNNETNCVRVPNGFYWFQPNITSPITYFKSINQISIVTTVGGVITAIDICDYVPPTTTTTTTI